MGPSKWRGLAEILARVELKRSDGMGRSLDTVFYL